MKNVARILQILYSLSERGQFWDDLMLVPQTLEEQKNETEETFAKARQLHIDLIDLPNLQAVLDEHQSYRSNLTYTHRLGKAVAS